MAEQANNLLTSIILIAESQRQTDHLEHYFRKLAQSHASMGLKNEHYHAWSVVMLCTMPDFCGAEYGRRHNDDLVATFGNPVHRVLTQLERNFEARVPDPGDLGPADRDLLERAEAAVEAAAASIEAARFREALNVGMGLARDANRYLDKQAPWRQIHEDKAGAGRTLYASLCVLAALDVVLYPFLPFSAQRLHELLGRTGRVEDEPWEAAWPLPGTALPKPVPLFTKLDDSVVEEMASKLGTSGEAASPS